MNGLNFIRISLIILGILCALAAPVRSQQDAQLTGGELTLDDAITIALGENRSIKNARLGVENSKDQLAAIRTERYPILKTYAVIAEDLVKHDVNLPNPLSSLIPGVGPFFTLSTARRPTAVFAAQALQPISQQYKIGLGINLAKLEHQIDQEKLREQKQALVNDVKRAYYSILLTESSLESMRDEVSSYRELARVSGESVIQHVVLRAEFLQVQTRLAKAEYDLADLGNRLATQKEQLNRLLGRDVFTEFSVKPVSKTIGFETDVAAARRHAIDQRPELKQARLRIEQTTFDKKIKKSEYIPNVSAGFTYMKLANFDAAVPRDVAAVGVAMSWEVFDWGRKKHELAEKSRTIEHAENVAREIEDQILIDVSDKFRKLQQTGLALRVAKADCDAERERLRLMKANYTVSAVLLSDVLQSQASASEADHRYQQALLSFWTAKAEYEKALGDDK